MGFEGGEPFGYAVGFSGENAYEESEDTFVMAHDLADTPLEGCRDMFMHEGSPSLGCNDAIPNPLDFHVHTMCSQPSSFPELDFDGPIDKFKLCDF